MNDYKIVELTCGLGNQMFQYAFAKVLQKHLQAPILLDKTWYDTQGDSIQFGLNIFQLDLPYATKAQIEYAKARTTRLPGFLRKMFGVRKNKIASSEAFDFHPEYLSPNDYLYFSGFFQNARYFKSFEAELRDIFTYSPDNFSDFAKQRLEKILHTQNSVFIHIRRGDYCQFGWELGIDYYKKAIRYIVERVEKPKFFIFGATDKAFIERLEIGVPFEDVSERMIMHSNQHEDMFLMNYCKHAIVANSSYSFWGAYLNEERNRIVTAPSPWLLGRDDVICDDWIKISRLEG